jgi:uroporphyrin-III C-methyltransferase
MPGKVYLVGCGPGAADLLTLRAIKTLRKADVVLYDRLIDPKALSYAKRARKIPSGKHPGEPLKQDWINRKLLSEARAGKIVVRLKNGDPMVFGRGGEELQYLQERGVDVEVVPGLSSAISVPSFFKIPLTQRRMSSSLTVLTGHRAGRARQQWHHLGDTVVVLMAVGNLGTVAQRLKRAGKNGSTLCALISQGTTKGERLVVATLDKIATLSKRLGVNAPAVLVVGNVVRSLLDFRGRRVTAFRPRGEVRRTERLIKRAGGLPNVFGVCEIIPAEDELKRVASERWEALVFTSPSGVRSATKFFDFNEYELIAVGERTQHELKRRGHQRVLVSRVQNLEGVEEFLKKKKFGRVLAFRSPLALKGLEGATNVVAYQVKPRNLSRVVKSYLNNGSDITLLTSAGLLELLLKVSSELGLRRKFVSRMNASFVISVGPNTTARALEAGIKVNYELENSTLDSLFRRR